MDIRRERHVACTGKMRSAHKVWFKNLKSGRRLGRPRHRWKDNIKINFREIG
jgi:hypothetical protein